MTPTTDLGLSIRLFVFELRETGDWDLFLRHPERARAETGGADQWALKRRESPGFAIVNIITPTSLGYPLSVLNQDSTHTPNAIGCVFEISVSISRVYALVLSLGRATNLMCH